MEIMGKLKQGDGLSTIDETLVFATKTTGSKNFYLALVGLISGGSNTGFWVPYSGIITTIIASLGGNASSTVTFNLRNIDTNTIVHTFTIAQGTKEIYLPDLSIAVPAGAELVMECRSTTNVVNPMVRILIGKKV